MIYYMSTKTLVNNFTKEINPEVILGCTFVKYSTRISNTEKMKTITYSERTVFGLKETTVEKHMVDNIRITKKFLLSDLTSMVTIINMVATSLANKNEIFVILSSKKEYDSGITMILAKTIEDMFKYPIINYKKEKDNSFSYDETETVNRLYHFKIVANWLRYQKYEGSIDVATKEELKDVAKLINVWQKGMSKKDMKTAIHDCAGLPFRL